MNNSGKNRRNYSLLIYANLRNAYHIGMDKYLAIHYCDVIIYY